MFQLYAGRVSQFARGETGPIGIVGPLGLVGPIGHTGPQGPKGPMGFPGSPRDMGTGSSSFIRWGRKECSDSSELVYTGMWKVQKVDFILEVIF